MPSIIPNLSTTYVERSMNSFELLYICENFYSRVTQFKHVASISVYNFKDSKGHKIILPNGTVARRGEKRTKDN